MFSPANSERVPYRDTTRRSDFPLALVVEDDHSSASFFSGMLRQAGCDVKVLGKLAGLKDLISTERPSFVLLDNHLPDGVGLEALPGLLEHEPELPVIIMTGHYSIAGAVEAIHHGAIDYLAKPCDEKSLMERIRRWMTDQPNPKLGRDGTATVAESPLSGIIGASRPMRELFERARRVATHFDTLLLDGETGSGKDRIAFAIHRLGLGDGAPFIPVNCAGLSETLFESELFGYLRGAFTGASQDRDGLIKAANHGTLFLDEIGELPLHLQAKLLRTLQSKEVRPVGATKSIHVDVRVIAATNRDLRAMVREGKFRQDLYFRLNTVSLRVPPLRERLDDLPELINHFLTRYCRQYKREPLRLTADALHRFMRYSWPGNVRELESAISYCCMTVPGNWVESHDLPEWIVDEAPASVVFDDDDCDDCDEFLKVDELVERHIRKALKRANGNRTVAAELLGISRTTIHRMLQRQSG